MHVAKWPKKEAIWPFVATIDPNRACLAAYRRNKADDLTRDKDFVEGSEKACDAIVIGAGHHRLPLGGSAGATHP